MLFWEYLLPSPSQVIPFYLRGEGWWTAWEGGWGQTGGKVFMSEANHQTHTFVVMRKCDSSQRLTVLSPGWHVVVHLMLTANLILSPENKTKKTGNRHKKPQTWTTSLSDKNRCFDIWATSAHNKYNCEKQFSNYVIAFNAFTQILQLSILLEYSYFSFILLFTSMPLHFKQTLYCFTPLHLSDLVTLQILL